MRITATLVIALGGWSMFASEGFGQYPGSRFGGFGGGQFARPTVSPYLNLTQGGNPAINYYGLVRPQNAYNRAFQTLGNDVYGLEANALANQPGETGHPSSFMTHYQYFMNNGFASGRTSGYQSGSSLGPTPAAQQSAQQGAQQRKGR